MTRYSWIGCIAVAVGLSILVGACISYTPFAPRPADNGLKFVHPVHIEQGIDCDSCHEQQDGRMQFPTHDLCSMCHEFDVDNPTEESCNFCHERTDYTVDDRVNLLSEERKFSHDPHIAKEIACTECHADPDKAVITETPLMPFCMDCHGKTDPKLNECATCHTVINKETPPTHRGKTRIQHDSPAIWEQIHGQEAQRDPAYCAKCHEPVAEHCGSCHQNKAPANHTVSWRRKTHGLHASWDRSNCAVCHEEDSCLKCHRNTQPTSHRRGWGKPLDRHCTTCHFPPSQTNCVVCHETIDHKTAVRAPHRFNIFPKNCTICHPGGLPGRAPHPVNSTVRCEFCH